MYEAITQQICVNVLPVYIDERSDPTAGQFFWAYRVVIENQSENTVQLISRYWKITDGHGNIEEVRGEGVVGEQPVLTPGERFEYTSGCPLSTPSGIMVGHYVMAEQGGGEFCADIPAFSLDLPDVQHTFN